MTERQWKEKVQLGLKKKKPLSDKESKHCQLGSAASPVIQENGKLSFEDDLSSGGLIYCVS